jgi:hypothetical protein
MNTIPLPRGAELLATIPDGVKLIGMVLHGGHLVIATETAIYWLDGDVFRPFQIVDEN